MGTSLPFDPRDVALREAMPTTAATPQVSSKALRSPAGSL